MRKDIEASEYNVALSETPTRFPVEVPEPADSDEPKSGEEEQSGFLPKTGSEINAEQAEAAKAAGKEYQGKEPGEKKDD